MKDKNMLKIAAGLFVMANTLPLSAQEGVVFTDSPDLYYNSSWGTSRAERYDVAVSLSFPRLEGTKIESITFPWRGSEGVTDVKIWLSKELKVENKVNIPDVMEVDAVCSDGRVSATLSEPYEIGEGGVFAGLSFTVEVKDTEPQKAPVAALRSDDMFGTGFWIHTSSTYGNRWKNLQEEYGEVPVFEVSLDVADPYAVTLDVAGEFYSVAGESASIPVAISSYGSQRVENLTVAERRGGEESGEITLETEKDARFYFGYPVAATLTLPSGDVKGRQELSLSVEKVNGEVNALAEESDEITLFVCSSRPEHRPLFEEYTGTGCGNCPRGTLGMEKLTEMYGDRFVGVAYHVSDIMSIADIEGYPNYAPAQPDAYIDRYVKTDPYFGTDMSKMEFLVPEVWEAQEEIFAPAHFSLTCNWADEARERLDVTADFTFVRDYEDADFRVAYILVSDGLRGEGVNWRQANYYSGESGRWPADFDQFVDAPRYIEDMTYNHVAIALPEKDGVAGSVPSEISADAAMSHSYTFDLSEAVNLKGESLVQDKKDIYVVAALVDASTGHVVNSAKATPAQLAVEDLETADEPVAVEFVTLQGYKLERVLKGEPVIEVSRYSDGRVKTRKVML